jgi:hypothetical protein
MNVNVNSNGNYGNKVTTASIKILVTLETKVTMVVVDNSTKLI